MFCSSAFRGISSNLLSLFKGISSSLLSCLFFLQTHAPIKPKTPRNKAPKVDVMIVQASAFATVGADVEIVASVDIKPGGRVITYKSVR